jgi:hypothetical protein
MYRPVVVAVCFPFSFCSFCGRHCLCLCLQTSPPFHRARRVSCPFIGLVCGCHSPLNKIAPLTEIEYGSALLCSLATRMIISQHFLLFNACASFSFACPSMSKYGGGIAASSCLRGYCEESFCICRSHACTQIHRMSSGMACCSLHPSCSCMPCRACSSTTTLATT